MRATPLTHHTVDLSYVTHEISQIVSRFVQQLLEGDGCVCASWPTPTLMGDPAIKFYLMAHRWLIHFQAQLHHESLS